MRGKPLISEIIKRIELKLTVLDKYCPFCNTATSSDNCKNCYGIFPVLSGNIANEQEHIGSGFLIPQYTKGNPVTIKSDIEFKISYN